MRKAHGVLGMTILGAMFLADGIAIYGPWPLPDNIPTHFDAAGHPDGWSSNTFFIVLPFVALVFYMIITMVARYPARSGYALDISPESRSPVESLALGLISWLRFEMVGIFASIQAAMLQAIYFSNRSVSLFGLWAILAIIVITVIYYGLAMLVTLRPHKPSRADPHKVLRRWPDRRNG